MNQARAPQLRKVSIGSDSLSALTFMLSFSNNAFNVFRNTSIRSIQNPLDPARFE